MRYHNITKDDMLNGTGLRVVLWVSGCDHACEGCHNTITWDVYSGIPFGEADKQEIYEELKKDYISGITLSGGDPLHPIHREEIGELIKDIKKQFPNKTIWLYTGYVWDNIKNIPFIKDVDVVIDGPFIIDLMDSRLHWKGSSNQKIIDVHKTYSTREIVLYEK